VGALLSVAGLVILVVFAVRHGTGWEIVGVSVFGASLVLLYTSSSLHHAFSCKGGRRIFQVLDHGFIFVLIAGSYTPFVLGPLRGTLGWWLFGIIWGLAILGFVLKAFFVERFVRTTTALYLLMGWLMVLATSQILEKLPTAGIVWLVIGGLSYSFGVIFFLMDRMKFAHTIWHLFVLVGSASHFFAVIYGVLLLGQGNVEF